MKLLSRRRKKGTKIWKLLVMKTHYSINASIQVKHTSLAVGLDLTAFGATTAGVR